MLSFSVLLSFIVNNGIIENTFNYSIIDSVFNHNFFAVAYVFFFLRVVDNSILFNLQRLTELNVTTNY